MGGKKNLWKTFLQKSKNFPISYLLKQKVDIKVLEKVVHYKQKNNITNHYAVKEASKSVGLLLAKASAEESNEINNNNINRNDVKNLEIKIDNPQTLDLDVNKIIPLLNEINSPYVWTACVPCLYCVWGVS
jgi:hypothetical protein